MGQSVSGATLTNTSRTCQKHEQNSITSQQQHYGSRSVCPHPASHQRWLALAFSFLHPRLLSIMPSSSSAAVERNASTPLAPPPPSPLTHHPLPKPPLPHDPRASSSSTFSSHSALGLSRPLPPPPASLPATRGMLGLNLTPRQSLWVNLSQPSQPQPQPLTSSSQSSLQSHSVMLVCCVACCCCYSQRCNRSVLRVGLHVA